MKADDEPVTMAEYRRLVARHDALDGRVTDLHRKTIRELAGEVAAVKRAITTLLQRQGGQHGQPEWIGNRDVDAARAMLTAVQEWVEGVARPLGLDVVACWPWHGAAVAVLLAGVQHYRAAYDGDRADAVTDFHTRHLDALERRVQALTTGCDQHRHVIGQVEFRLPGDVAERLPQLAGWYVTGAEGLPPGLRELQRHG